MLKAVIDLGSNSFKLSVGKLEKKSISFIYEEKIFVPLPEFGEEKQIDQEDESQIFEKLELLINHGKRTGCDYFELIGTSFFRKRETETWFRKNLNERNINYPFKVLSGEEEAFYIAEAVLAETQISDCIIMDIGGGSIEFIEIRNKKINWSESLDTGVRRWQEKFTHKKNLDAQNVSVIEKELDQILLPHLKKVKSNFLIGSAGSFETFYSILKKKEYHPDEVKHFKANYTEIKNILKDLIYSSEKIRNEHPWIEAGRKKYIAYAALITDYVCKNIPIEYIKIASHALKEGYLSNLLLSEEK